MNDDYSIVTQKSYAICSFSVPLWVNEAVVRMILSDPVFLEDVKNANRQYSSLAHRYADLVRDYTDKEASKWASQYIPKTAPAFCVQCESSVMEIMFSLPEGLPCVPFRTDDDGIEGTIDDNLLYDKSCRGDVGSLVTLKATDLMNTRAKKESEAFNKDAYALASLSRFLFPDKACSTYKTSLLGLDECPAATGRLQSVGTGRVSIGLFTPVTGRYGGTNQKMMNEAESVYKRFMDRLEPLKKAVDNDIQSWIDSIATIDQEGEQNATLS